MKDTIREVRALRKYQGGFTAIELIVVLIVGLGIIALAAGNMDKLFGSSALSEELSNINMLHVNTRSLRTTSGYGAAGTNLVEQLNAVKGIPRNMAVSGSGSTMTITNSWGGTVPVVSTGVGFTITQNSVPRDACIKIATRVSKGGTFTSVAINGHTAHTGEIASATATTQCSSATANTIVFTSAN